jgi:hypothetical protein
LIRQYRWCEESGEDDHDDDDREKLVVDDAETATNGGKYQSHFTARHQAPAYEGFLHFPGCEARDDFADKCHYGNAESDENDGGPLWQVLAQDYSLLCVEHGCTFLDKNPIIQNALEKYPSLLLGSGKQAPINSEQLVQLRRYVRAIGFKPELIG